MAIPRLTSAQARRAAVRAQLLTARRPTDLLATVEQLTSLQLDPTAAVAPSADLVAWTRLGDRYHPDDLKRLHEVDRSVFERRAFVRPTADLGLSMASMRVWPGTDFAEARRWMEVNDPFRRDVLEVLGARGPLLSREVPDTAVQPWRSSGWTGNRNVTQMLEFLNARGRGRDRRRGRDGNGSGTSPSGSTPPTSWCCRSRRRWSSGSGGCCARSGSRGRASSAGPARRSRSPGTPGTWRVDPAALEGRFAGRTALLSPFDRLVHDRVRAQELFGFEYVLEMYKPKAARRWGYFALPVLHGDRLVGKVDTTADRKAGVLRVDAVHQDVPFTAAITAGVDRELEAFARWRGLDRVERA